MKILVRVCSMVSNNFLWIRFRVSKSFNVVENCCNGFCDVISVVIVFVPVMFCFLDYFIMIVKLFFGVVCQVLSWYIFIDKKK